MRSLQAGATMLKFWLRMGDIFPDILMRLAKAASLAPSSEYLQTKRSGAFVPSKHDDYLSKLRSGVSIRRIRGPTDPMHSAMRYLQRDSLDAVRLDDSGNIHIGDAKVVTQVADEQVAATLEYWQQGDMTLYTDENMRKRLQLCVEDARRPVPTVPSPVPHARMLAS